MCRSLPPEANHVVVNFAETDELAPSDPCPLSDLSVCDRETASECRAGREQPLYPPTAETLLLS